MRCVSVCVVAAAAALLWAGVARAEREAQPAGSAFGSPPKPPPAKVNSALARPAVFAAASAASAKKMSVEQRDERRFLKEASAASRFESEASRMALAKSNNPRVRSFAATLINHHATTGIALQHMLQGRGMAPPMLANDQRKTLNRLAKLGGAKFDREYTEEVGLRYQHEDLQVYEKAALATRDPTLKAWIARTLPTLRYHLATAERISASHAPAPRPVVSRAGLATQFMGAGPMQLGVTQPVAARPTESNTR